MKTILTQLDLSWRAKDYPLVRQILKRTSKDCAMNFAVLVALRDGGEQAALLLGLLLNPPLMPTVQSKPTLGEHGTSPDSAQRG
jgi:hypothetical protein